MTIPNKYPNQDLIERKIAKLVKEQTIRIKKGRSILNISFAIKNYEDEMNRIDQDAKIFIDLLKEKSITKAVFDIKIKELNKKSELEFNKLIGLCTNIEDYRIAFEKVSPV